MSSLLRNKPVRSCQPPTHARQLRRIILVEDHPIVSSGLAALINDEPGLQVCAIARDYATALEIMETFRPDLIILDICLKGRDGLELLKDIKSRCPGQRVLVLSMHDESLYASRALRAGASGYVMKLAAMETILTAIHRVIEGDVYLSAPMQKEVLRGVLKLQSAAEIDPFERLTNRELEVFRRIGQAQSTRAIATELHLSTKTIESHRGHLRKKLNLREGRELLRYALSRQQEQMMANAGAAG